MCVSPTILELIKECQVFRSFVLPGVVTAIVVNLVGAAVVAVTKPDIAS